MELELLKLEINKKVRIIDFEKKRSGNSSQNCGFKFPFVKYTESHGPGGVSDNLKKAIFNVSTVVATMQ